MKLIAAVDKNWGIGRNNRLLVNIPEDMQLFRQETNGKVVIMGRKTFESLKEKSPLYGRKNIVLTTNKSYDAKGAVVCASVEEVLDAVKDYDDNDKYGQGRKNDSIVYFDKGRIELSGNVSLKWQPVNRLGMSLSFGEKCSGLNGHRLFLPFL